MDGDGQILQRIQNLKILKSCEELIANHNKKEALALMELWSRLIPEDDDMPGSNYIWQKQCVHVRRDEIEKKSVKSGL